jgi:hypothetical protein
VFQGEGQDVGVGQVEHGNLRGEGISDRGMVSQDGIMVEGGKDYGEWGEWANLANII